MGSDPGRALENERRRRRVTHISRSHAAGSQGAGFDRFDLRPELLRAVSEAGFETTRPIQERTLPLALAGRDVLGLAQTGTGKTAAFVLPILQRLLGSPGPGPRALVVAPTRELAAQVQADFERLARHTPVDSIALFGGVPIARQERAMRRPPQVVVACPGRLLDLLNRRVFSLDRVEVLVLDEADHMFDMGFLPDVRRILRALPARRQNLLFSATMPNEVRHLADGILNRPVVVELAASRPADTIDHALLPVEESGKIGALERLLAAEDFRSAIVFLRTKRRAKKLAQRLDRCGHSAVAMQGNMSQPQRERALKGFREGRYDVLVATDIAARGLDIAGVSHVVNFDVPNTPDAYTHRIGRTGRSGLAGSALTFVTSADAEAVRAIEKRLGAPIERRGGRAEAAAGPGSRRGGRPAQAETTRRPGKAERSEKGRRADGAGRSANGRQATNGRRAGDVRRSEGSPRTAVRPSLPARPEFASVAFGQGVFDA